VPFHSLLARHRRHVYYIDEAGDRTASEWLVRVRGSQGDLHDDAPVAVTRSWRKSSYTVHLSRRDTDKRKILSRGDDHRCLNVNARPVTRRLQGCRQSYERRLVSCAGNTAAQGFR
jgi:hypothetical protein